MLSRVQKWRMGNNKEILLLTSETLVKETGWNDEVEGSEQRGCSLVEEMSVIPPFLKLCNTVSKTP